MQGTTTGYFYYTLLLPSHLGLKKAKTKGEKGSNKTIPRAEKEKESFTSAKMQPHSHAIESYNAVVLHVHVRLAQWLVAAVWSPFDRPKKGGKIYCPAPLFRVAAQDPR